MKNRIILLVVFGVLGILTSQVQAQLTVGARAGLTYTTWHLSPQPVIMEHGTGFELAVPLEMRINEWISFQSELNFTHRAISYRRPRAGTNGSGLLLGNQGNIQLNYVQIPFLGKFGPRGKDWNFAAFAGPTLGFSLGGNATQSFSDISEMPEQVELTLDGDGTVGDTESLELGITFGAEVGYSIPTHKISRRRRPQLVLDVRYHWGLTNLDASLLDDQITHRSTIISIGYRVPVGRR